MKYTFISFLALLLAIIFVGCSTSGSAPQDDHLIAPSSSLAHSRSLGIPPQPIGFDSLSEALAYIKKPDNSECSNYEWLQAYQDMVYKFRSAGYLYQVVASSDSGISYLRSDRTPTLYPQTANEDSGISWWVSYKGKEYQVLIYHMANSENAQPSALPEYFLQRFGNELRYKEAQKIRENLCYLESIDLDTPEMRAYSLIDSGHYLRIRSFGSQEELEEFLNVLSLQKIHIDGSLQSSTHTWVVIGVSLGVGLFACISLIAIYKKKKAA